MASYKELLAQREQLEQQIATARQAEITTAVAQVRELVAQFNLTADDIFTAQRSTRSTKGTSVAPKYRNPATGETWTGRGKPPRWIADQDREQFLIA